MVEEEAEAMTDAKKKTAKSTASTTESKAMTAHSAIIQHRIISGIPTLPT